MASTTVHLSAPETLFGATLALAALPLSPEQAALSLRLCDTLEAHWDALATGGDGGVFHAPRLAPGSWDAECRSACLRLTAACDKVKPAALRA